MLFSATTWPHDCNKFTLINRKIDATKREVLSVANAETFFLGLVIQLLVSCVSSSLIYIIGFLFYFCHHEIRFFFIAPKNGSGKHNICSRYLL